MNWGTIKSREAQQALLQLCSAILKNGGVIAVPTDTVYGLIADATHRKGVSKIFQIKGRDEKKMLPVFVKNIDAAKNITSHTIEHVNFLEKVWPGPFTAILPLHPEATIDRRVTSKNTIALRTPKHALTAKILHTYPNPLAQTSANPAGMPPATTANEVLAYFKTAKHYPDLILEGKCGTHITPSTIVNLTQTPWKTLRTGHITNKHLQTLKQHGVQLQ